MNRGDDGFAVFPGLPPSKPTRSLDVRRFEPRGMPVANAFHYHVHLLTTTRGGDGAGRRWRRHPGLDSEMTAPRIAAFTRGKISNWRHRDVASLTRAACYKASLWQNSNSEEDRFFLKYRIFLRFPETRVFNIVFATFFP